MEHVSSDQLVCFLCREEVPGDFPERMLAGESWACSVCGCDRFVTDRFYDHDFERKIERLRQARDERSGRMERLKTRARSDSREAISTRRDISGPDIANALEQALTATGLSRLDAADTYLQIYFDVLREHRLDIDATLAAAGLALCWWCRRPLNEHADETLPAADQTT